MAEIVQSIFLNAFLGKQVFPTKSGNTMLGDAKLFTPRVVVSWFKHWAPIY